MAELDPEAGFAAIYDEIYGCEPAFFSAQLAFLVAQVGNGRSVLDAGCGTGRHLIALRRMGFSVAGLDASQCMLARAAANLAAATTTAPLVLGRLQALPFAGAFDAVLCLESPLAYLLEDKDLAAALTSSKGALLPGGRLIIDLFDYPATLNEGGRRPHRRSYPTEWGSIEVVERHRFDPGAGVWSMQQGFTVQRGLQQDNFRITHRLRIRPADAYAAALEAAGFKILELWPAYPGTPIELRHEERMIFVASC